MKKLFVCTLFALFMGGSAYAQFSGSGSGTSEDPYRIFNAVQFNQMRNIPDAVFSIEADIDMKAWIDDNNPTQGWLPFAFEGTLRGNGHTVSNLYINRPEKSSVGLFSLVSDGIISGLRLENCRITGGSYTGGIAGETRSVQISDCIVEGTVSGNSRVGGVVGYSSENTYNNCVYIGNVTGQDYVGGVVSFSYGNTYNNCTCIGNITGQDYVGGIVGYSSINTYNNCVYIGNVTGRNYVGGIVALGVSYEVLKNSYACGRVEGIKYVGGILGSSSGSSCQISCCYAGQSLISGHQYVAGISGYGGEISYCVAVVGSIYNGVRIANEPVTATNNYAWNRTAIHHDGVLQPMPDDGEEQGTNTGISTLRLKATYAGMGWDFDTIWKIEEGESLPYFLRQTTPPFFSQELRRGDTRLEGSCIETGIVEIGVGNKHYTASVTGNRWQVTVDSLEAGNEVVVMACADGKEPSYPVAVTVGFLGEGTLDDPWQVYSAVEMQHINDEGYYRLMNDLDLTDWISAHRPDEGWLPVNANTLTEFDGGGHTVSGLWMADNTQTNAGLFTVLNAGGTIKNLNVCLADDGIAGETYTGAIVGQNNGSIQQSVVSKTLVQGDNVGGIAGYSSGTISQCRVSEGLVKGQRYAGAIVGYSTGTVVDCYAESYVEASVSNAYAAGVAGRNDGTVSRCYASGNITGYYVAGIVGQNYGANAVVDHCVALNERLSGEKSVLRILSTFSEGAMAPEMDNYADKNVLMTLNGIPQTVYDDPVNGVGITASETKQSSTYTALGWDFDQVWCINENYGYPYFLRDRVLATALTLNLSDTTVYVGGSFQFVATLLPETATNKNLLWQSSDIDIATVTDSGFVECHSEGEVVIRATASDGSGVSAECRVTVRPVLVTAIALSQDAWTGKVGEELQLVATVTPADAMDKSIEWTSDSPEVAEVSAEGKVRLVSVGEAVIRATAGDGSGVSAECRVTALPVLVTAITLSQDTWTGKVGEELQLEATVTPADAMDKSIEWTSDSPEVAEVSAEGKVRLVSVGEAVIRATASDGSGVSAECRVTVRPVLVTAIALSQDAWTGKVGEELQLEATVTPADAMDKSIEWTSDSPEVAEVSAEGKVRLVSVGEAVIRATASDGSGVSAECRVTVRPVLVTAIALSQDAWTGKVGEELQLEATVTPADATDKSIEWTSDSPEVAEVSAEGKVRLVSVGEAVIRATAGDGSGVSAECRVTALPVLVTAIILDPTEIIRERYCVGGKIQLTATVLPENATNKRIIWTTSNDGIVQVDNGLVTIMAYGGEATITATAADGSGVSAICYVPNILSGVDAAPIDSMKVFVVQGEIVLESIPAGKLVRICRTDGTELFRKISDGSTMYYRPSLSGLYLVVVENFTFKVIVNGVS